jgi:hypothetical protein
MDSIGIGRPTARRARPRSTNRAEGQEPAAPARANGSRPPPKTRRQTKSSSNGRDKEAVPVEAQVHAPAAGADEDSAPYPVEPVPADGGVEQFQQAVKMEEARRLLARAEQDHAETQARVYPWRRERWGIECVVYPLRAVFLLLGLAVAWMLLAAFLVAVLPHDWEEDSLGVQLMLLLVAPVWMLFSYTCAACRCVLVSAARGEAGFVAWPGLDFAETMWSGLIGLACFLTGPVVPALVAGIFWLQGGDLALVDELILGELATLAVAGWSLAMITACGGGQLRFATFGSVARLVHRLGYRLLIVAVVGAAVAAWVGLRALGSLEELREGPGGWLVVTGWWTGTLFALVFLLRWLGLSCFYARKKRARRRRQEQANKQWDKLQLATAAAARQ